MKFDGKTVISMLFAIALVASAGTILYDWYKTIPAKHILSNDFRQADQTLTVRLAEYSVDSTNSEKVEGAILAAYSHALNLKSVYTTADFELLQQAYTSALFLLKEELANNSSLETGNRFRNQFASKILEIIED